MPELACVFSAFCWAVASGVYKKSSAQFGILPINLLRCLVSVALGLIVVPFTGGFSPALSASPTSLGYMAASGIMARLVGDSLFILSAAHIGISRAMPIAAIYPVWSVLLAVLAGEKLNPWEMGALLVTIAGVILVIRSGSAANRKNLGPSNPDFAGYLLAFGTSIAWALGLVATKWGALDMNPVLVNLLRMTAGAASLVLVLSLQGRLSLPPLSWGKGTLVGASALESWLASVAWVYGLAHTSTAVGASLSSLAPVLSIPVAIFYLREKVSLQLAAGILLATLGVIGLVSR